MADKAISELISAEQITATDLFVLEQNNTGKKLTGQVLLNWLTAAADGHGGIQKIEKTKTQGLVDTYTITLADTTTFSFNVTNGKSIQSIAKTGTTGLVDTYKISFNDGTSQTFTVTNGAKGDKGDNAYVHIKWASQEPTDGSHSFGDVPDNWMGIYSGNAATAPTDWQAYDWFEVKGEKGDTGAAASLLSQEVVYQVSDSGTIYPSGAWSSAVPVVPAGKYLWTRVSITFNSGAPIVSYSVGRMGIDGQGAVSSVANISPDSAGNVPLKASDVGAMPTTGGDFTGPVNMNGQILGGLNAPTESDHAVNMGFVTQKLGDIPDGKTVKDYVDGKTITTDKTLSVSGAAADAKVVGDRFKDILASVAADGPGAHNAIYRGKSLGNTVTAAQYAAIANGTFADLFIGDYWTIDGIVYRIAAFDYYYDTGNVACTTHHVTLVPDTCMYTHVMNDSDVTTDAYTGSKMYSDGLTTAKNTINAAFGPAHILNHRQLLTNATKNGYVSGGSWVDSIVELMNEQNVYGNVVFNSVANGSSVPYPCRKDRAAKEGRSISKGNESHASCHCKYAIVGRNGRCHPGRS